MDSKVQFIKFSFCRITGKPSIFLPETRIAYIARYQFCAYDNQRQYCVHVLAMTIFGQSYNVSNNNSKIKKKKSMINADAERNNLKCVN